MIWILAWLTILNNQPILKPYLCNNLNSEASIVMKTIKNTLIYLLILVVYLPFSHAGTPPQSAIASAHPLATAAGKSVLLQGGNAFDAAIAVASTLAVVEPYSSGLGGGGFLLLQKAGMEAVMLDARESAPAKAHRDMYLDKDGNVKTELSMTGATSAGIPGTPAALVYLAEKFGRLPLTQSLAPAIRHAREGFEVTDRYRHWANFRLDLLRQFPESSRIFLDKNNVPEPGHLIKQPELALTLEKIAATGKKDFYSGATARKMLAAIQAAGGIWTQSDLDNYKVIERKPVTGNYHGIRVTSASPPSSGGIVLISMLNILSGFDLEQMDSVTHKHLLIESMRRAYHDRTIYPGDPDFTDIPVERLLSAEYATKLRNNIDRTKATPDFSSRNTSPREESFHTTHFSILDQEGNRVAATLTINYPFGSGMVAGDTGVLLNDEMDDFSAKPGVPNAYGLVGAEANAIEPGKRPLSSMTPTFLETDDRLAILGTPGGSRIITMVLLATLDFAKGHLPESWVSLPRFHHQYLPDSVFYEHDALKEHEVKKLTSMGHRLNRLSSPYGDNDARYGNMQAIMWDKTTNKVYAASDPRGEGKPEVFISGK